MGTNTKTVANMVDINLITSIITLHINSLKSPIKRQRLSVWTQNQTQTIYCLKKETHFKYKDAQIKVKEQRRIYLGNSNKNKAGVAVLITDREEFREQKGIRD